MSDEFSKTSWFYGVARDSDFKLKKFKGGITDDPYDRLNPYGTGSMPDDEIRYRFLINVATTDKALLRKIEHLWLEQFPQIAQSIASTPQSLNRASSVEARMFKSVYDIIEVFRKTVMDLGLGDIVRGVYISENEIEGVLAVYQKLNTFTPEPPPIPPPSPQPPPSPSPEPDADAHIVKLNQFQEPYLQTLNNFLTDPSQPAAMVEAVCGFGKTVLTSKSLSNRVARLLIVVPTDSLKSYWRNDLIRFAGFQEADIYDIGGTGVIDDKEIRRIFKKARFALILCYASTPKLMDVLSPVVELAIFDEAHRLAGVAVVVSKSGSDSSDSEKEADDIQSHDIGRTKRLIRKCAELNIKRLSLTFTPKGFESDEQPDTIVNSNDDELLFGKPIIKVSLGQMIDVGLLPNYKILFPQGETTNGDTLRAKTQLFAQGFQKTDAAGSHLMHHGIIFGQDHVSCKKIAEYLNKEPQLEKDRPKVIYLDKASTLREKLKEFEDAPRAIVVNCMLLGEGVNIRQADSVCIMYAKKSFSQIIQMLLRAGRYYMTKPLFYIIMTLLDDDESEEIQFVLEALTKYDVHFDQQILKRILQTKDGHAPAKPKGEIQDEDGLDDKIQTTSVNWNDIPAIRKVFMTLIKRRTSRGTPHQQIHTIRKVCKQQNILSSAAYNRVRLLTGWIEEPWLKRNMTAYDFFHDENEERLSQDDFRKKITEQGIQSTDAYDVWFSKEGGTYPSIENINDGYFGKNFTNLQLFLPKGAGRRR